MKTIFLLLLGLLPALLRADDGATTDEKAPAPDKKVFGKSEEASYQGQVVVVKIGRDDLMNQQSFKFMRRTLRRANDEGARAVVFDIDTPGGYAYETKKLMSELVNLKVDSYAFVNPEAISAGALVSVATKAIYMTPGSMIGDAGLINSMGTEIDPVMRAKLESYFDANLRTILVRTGYDIELVRAMMFLAEEDRTFGEVVVKKGTLLTLTAEEAVSTYNGQPLLATAIVDDLGAMLKAEGLDQYPLVRADPTAFEKIAWWVKYLSPLLIIIGVGAAYAEMKMPGFGVGGVVSLIAFGVFFFGNFAAGNLAGYELAAVFVLGIILILVEIFIIPGTGVTGILGALLIVGALLAGMIDSIEFEDFSSEGFSGGEAMRILKTPATSLAIGLTGGIVMVMLLMRFMGAIPGVKWLSLGQQIAGGASLTDSGSPAESRIGWTGVATTDLRPAGKAEFEGETLDVVTDGAFIAKGDQVRISEEEGMRIEVRKA